MSGIDIRRIDGVSPPVIPPAVFVELCVTTPFSFGHGASHSWELVTVACSQGCDAIGCADRNTLSGAPRMHLHGKEAALRPLIGCRLVLEDAPDIIAYPRDRTAYGRLTRLLTLGKNRQEGVKPVPGKRVDGKCRLWLADLAEHGEGMALIAMPGADLDRFEREWPRLVEKVPGIEYIAAPRLHGGDDRARINRLDRLARAWGRTILATSDVLYHHPSRRPLADVIACIDHRTTIREAGRMLGANGERHLRSPGEMARLYGEWPHAVKATRTLADSIAFSLDELAYHYPDEPVPPGKTADEHLADLTWAGAAWRYPDGVPSTVRETLCEELRLIGKLGYAHYFLTVHDVVAWARERGILCQGRGSAANSAVCFCIGVTNVDPAKHSLLIARFISDARDEPPDIDVDFEHERREEVIQYVYQRYGRHRAALAATVIHYRPRMAIREVGRVMGLSEDVTAAIAKTVWGSWGTEIVDKHMREAGLNPDDPHLKRTVRLASELIGMPRHLSQHVGGFVLTQDPLIETAPTLWGAMPDRTFIEWDKDDLDALGLMKVDVLALGMLTCVRKAFDLVEQHTGVRHDLAEVGLSEEPGVYAMLGHADSLGVFQIESRAQMAMLPRLRPKKFYDLVIEVAIVRPGPIQGDMVHPYLKRREGAEPIVYPAPGPDHPQDELQKILGRTLGVPIFQEQAMAIAMEAAQFTGDEANELRRAMATFRSRGTITELQDKMVGRMIERGYDPGFARSCFEQIKGFGEYGFPESHAASFAHLVYVSSWLKWRYPDAFAAALLNAQPMGFYAPAQIVRDAREHGVEVRPPDVNVSDWDCALEPLAPDDRLPGIGHNGVHAPLHALRLGLRQIDRFGEASAALLTAARDDTPFASVADLHERTGLPRDAVEALAAADAFRSCGLTRRRALWDCRGLDDAPPAPLAPRGRERQASLPLMPASEEVVADYQTTRLSLRAHPLTFLRAHYGAHGLVRSDRMVEASGPMQRLDRGARGARRVEVAGLVLVRQRPGSAKGVCFLTLEDEAGPINIVVWPTVMEANRRTVMASRLLRVRGRVQVGDGVVHLVAERLVDDSALLSQLSDAEELGRALDHQLARADHVARPLPAKWQAPADAGLPKARTVVPEARTVEDTCRPNEARPAYTRAPEPRRSHPRDAVIIPRAREFR